MSISSGTRLGPYEVLGLIGAGGMGEVYRARDTRLGRTVAIKVLPGDLSSSPDRRARFEREAKAIAGLADPHICTLHDVGEHEGSLFLVMEHLDGATLARRLERGPVPIEQALTIAAEIADALSAAHRQGIVHRDLKPGNVMLTKSGAKLLDFGLAKLIGRGDQPAVAPLMSAPTYSASLTGDGVMLGTLHYMAPEQVEGREADARSDLWALGAILYEMVAGKRAFEGTSPASVIGGILEREPPSLSAVQPLASPALDQLVRQCLAKSPDDRPDTAHDLANDLRLITVSSGIGSVGVVRPAPTRWRLGATVLVLLVAAGVVVAGLLFKAPDTAQRLEMRLHIATPRVESPFWLALAPDGRSIVYHGREGNRSLLWLRPLDSEEARPLTGTEGGIYPFWSPDSRTVGFFADSMLKRIDLASGFVRTVAAAPNPRQAAWGQDGTILFGASVGPLLRVSAEGGVPAEATTLLPGQSNHRLPQFLPGGRRFLLYALGTPEVRGVYVASLADKNVRQIGTEETPYAFMPPDHLLFAREGALWARGLNVDSASPVGRLFPVSPHVLVHPTITALGAFSAAAVGSIAFRASAGTRQLEWLDRAGNPVGTLGPLDDAQLDLEHLSVDGRAAAVVRTVSGNHDVWILDTERGVPRRLTFAPGVKGSARFSPDRSRVVYVSDERAQVWEIFVRASDGTGEGALTYESGENKQVLDVSPDGRYLLYAIQDQRTDYDIWALDLEGKPRPFPLARSRFAEYDARFSPDGKWIAFDSTETGRAEVYVQAFPEPGASVQVSAGGGSGPRWRRDGRELFYVSPASQLMAVSITSGKGTLDAAAPRALFTLREPFLGSYEPAPDGQRFLVPMVKSQPSPITIILNWKPPR